MILRNNFINNDNNISISISPDIQQESITITIHYRKNGNFNVLEYKNFKTACKKFKALEKQIEKEVKTICK